MKTELTLLRGVAVFFAAYAMWWLHEYWTIADSRGISILILLHLCLAVWLMLLWIRRPVARTVHAILGLTLAAVPALVFMPLGLGDRTSLSEVLVTLFLSEFWPVFYLIMLYTSKGFREFFNSPQTSSVAK
jgi:hypothetical protein